MMFQNVLHVSVVLNIVDVLLVAYFECYAFDQYINLFQKNKVTAAVTWNTTILLWMSPCDSQMLIIQLREDTGNSVKCGKYTVCFSLCMWKVLCWQNSFPVSEKVYRTHVRSQQQAWMWCSAFSNGRMWATCNNLDTQADDNMCYEDAYYYRGQMP